MINKIASPRIDQCHLCTETGGMFELRFLIFGSILAAVLALPCFIKVIRLPITPMPIPTQPPNNNNNNNNNSGGTIDPRFSRMIACDDDQIPCEVTFKLASPSKRPKCGSRFISSLDPSNGETTLGAHPWLAYIVNQMGYAGSGALIDRFHVITAAHIVVLHMNSPSTLKVYMGVHNPTKTMTTAEMRRVDQIQIHPYFEPDTLKNDIAILRLNTPIQLGSDINIGTICLPEDSKEYIGKKCLVAGWGPSSIGTFNDNAAVQHQVRVPIVDYNTCLDAMSQDNALGSNVNNYLDKNQHICVGGQTNNDACSESGGAPLVCQNESTKRFHAVGLVSWGVGCGKKGVYGVYVDVFKYRKWIDETTLDFYS